MSQEFEFVLIEENALLLTADAEENVIYLLKFLMNKIKKR